MIDAKRLLTDLQKLCKRLEDDLRDRSVSNEAMNTALRSEYETARQANRTAEAYEVWRDAILTQAAVAWILGGVFVRFLEDNGIVDPLITAPDNDRAQLALDREEAYFRGKPTDSYRDYLLDVYRTVAGFKATASLYDPEHNPLWNYQISGDAAKQLLQFWRAVDPDSGTLIHDFTDPDWATRFLGDLYQDLSEAVRKRYALLQTPDFVEAFILDRTLEPAIQEFGLKTVRMIDPTCGSGHFLLGGFDRLLQKWETKEPGTPERALVQRALDGVYGVDINPYAVAIARFRLLIAALKASGLHRLADAPEYRINVTAGDSLLHGARQLGLGGEIEAARLQSEGLQHAFKHENLHDLNRILGQDYHAVVGNPPYITVKDRALNAAYRQRYETCHMKYSLGVPFTERFFQLAVAGSNGQVAGFVGMITADSFMKREFGKALIERFFPQKDLTHVIATSGAYIPGHGTPTVILFGQNQSPISSTVRTVMSIKGEPSTPVDPSKGLVWTAITSQVDVPESVSDYISVADVDRSTFAVHPWSLGGGGASELKDQIELYSIKRLSECSDSIGIASFTLEDEVYLLPRDVPSRIGLPNSQIRPMVTGDIIRDWSSSFGNLAIFPYTCELKPLPFDLHNHTFKYLWDFRTNLGNCKMFGKQTKVEAGLAWWEYGRLTASKLQSPLSITFAFVATHNHFVLDRGGKVFNRSAPVIKLPDGSTEDDHLKLLGLLNSSTACFWMKQVFHCKGAQGINEGLKSEKWMQFFEFDGTKIKAFPIPGDMPIELAARADSLARELTAVLPEAVAQRAVPTGYELEQSHEIATQIRRQLISLQEELDWSCYRLYGLTEGSSEFADAPPISPGERAFEILMARQIVVGNLDTAWFELHNLTPITEIPAHWPDDYKRIVEKRIELILSDRNIGLIERPEYKRRWNSRPWEELEKEALQGWLLDRLETEHYWPSVRVQSTRDLATIAQSDADFLQVAELYRGHAGFDLYTLVTELVQGEAVPFLPVLRYKASGLRNREVWERTWELQRQEDAVDARVTAELQQAEGESDEAYRKRLEAEQRERKKAEIGDIPAPPKYKSADFLKNTFWRLRGALDVPKERFISYPFCSRDADPTLLVGWAGWDHLQQAQALANYYTEVMTEEGWSEERLKPLLAGMRELIPWLKQWHNEIDPEFGERMGDFFETFLTGQLQQHGLTEADLKAWQPPATAARRGRAPRRAAAEA